MTHDKHLYRGQQRDDILAEATQRETPLTLTHRTDEGWVSYSARFLEVVSPGRILGITAPVPRRAYVSVPVPLSKPVGAAFRKGHKKCLFTSTLEGPDPMDAPGMFTLSWPDELHQVRRRAYERAAPPPGMIIPVRFWCVARAMGAGSFDERVRYGELEDLSAGGMRVLVADTEGIDERSTYRCVVQVRAHAAPLVLEAVLRHREAAVGGRTSLGLGFMGLEANDEGRETLGEIARIVSQFQRSEGACRS